MKCFGNYHLDTAETELIWGTSSLMLIQNVGEEYWQNRNTEIMALMNCVNYHRMPENLRMCAMYLSLTLFLPMTSL